LLEEDEIVEENFLVDWASPPIYDIYPDEDDLLQEVSLSVDIVKFVEKNYVYHMFDESSNSEVSELGLRKLVMSFSFGIENFLSSSPNNEFDVGFYAINENFIFKEEIIIDIFWEIFMQIQFEKINQGFVKLELSQVGVQGFRIIIQNYHVIGCKLFFF
jgi:hypothetical protein